MGIVLDHHETLLLHGVACHRQRSPLDHTLWGHGLGWVHAL